MPVRKGPDCVGDEMRRFAKGELHSGKGGKIVTSAKQARAIAMSACGESEYAEILQSMGYSEEIANQVVSMFAESMVKASKKSSTSPSFEEMDWQKEFETGKAPAKENPENYHTGMTTKKGRGQLRIGKGPGDMGKLKVNSDSEMLSPVAYPKGPGNPQGGSSKEVQGMRMLG
jgi:hypothetical protein